MGVRKIRGHKLERIQYSTYYGKSIISITIVFITIFKALFHCSKYIACFALDTK